MALVPGAKKVNLPNEVNRVLFVRNLPFKISSDDMYELFGRFGTIRQIRKGTCFVIYDDIFDAKEACESLSGYNYQNRYLVVNYYNQHKWDMRVQKETEKKEMDSLKKKWGASTVTAE